MTYQQRQPPTPTTVLPSTVSTRNPTSTPDVQSTSIFNRISQTYGKPDTCGHNEHFLVAYPIVHPKTGAALEYRHLIKDTNLRDVWINSFANELGRLVQGRKRTNLEGTNTIFFIPYDLIPKNRRNNITYGRIVVNFRLQKQEPHRTRLTVGGNLNQYNRDLSTPTAELTKAKLLFNSGTTSTALSH